MGSGRHTCSCFLRFCSQPGRLLELPSLSPSPVHHIQVAGGGDNDDDDDHGSGGHYGGPNGGDGGVRCVLSGGGHTVFNSRPTHCRGISIIVK